MKMGYTFINYDEILKAFEKDKKAIDRNIQTVKDIQSGKIEPDSNNGVTFNKLFYNYYSMKMLLKHHEAFDVYAWINHKYPVKSDITGWLEYSYSNPMSAYKKMIEFFGEFGYTGKSGLVGVTYSGGYRPETMQYMLRVWIRRKQDIDSTCKSILKVIPHLKPWPSDIMGWKNIEGFKMLDVHTEGTMSYHLGIKDDKYYLFYNDNILRTYTDIKDCVNECWRMTEYRKECYSGHEERDD